MKPTHDIVIAQKYTKNGEEKTHWHKIGTLFTSEKDGKRTSSIKFSNVPLNWDGWANIFPIKPKETTEETSNPAPAPTEISDAPIDLSEIPF